MATDTDILIIGAGHNGLVCAAYLSQAGLNVLVVERSSYVGGGCITQELVPGYKFSTIAYAAHGPGPKICRDLQIPADAFTITELDPSMFAPFPDGDHIMIWNDTEKTANQLSRFGDREAEGYLAYQRFMAQAIGIAQDIFFDQPPTYAQLYNRYRGKPQASVLEALLTRSHWDILCDYFDHEKVRCAMARADDAGTPTAVGSLFGEVVESASEGAGIDNRSGIPRGGMGVISQALAEAGKRFGVQIRTDSPIEQILIEAGRAVGVRLVSGEQLRAHVVVSNADPKNTFLKLVAQSDVPDEFRRQVQKIKIKAGYMKYHAVLKGVPRFTALPGELVEDARHIASTRIAPSLAYYEQAWLDAQNGIPAREPIMSLQLPTAHLPDLAPPAKHIFGAWIRYAPTGLHDNQWDKLRQQTRDNFIRQVERYAPGFGDLIEWDRLYTPADIERETGITGGSVRHVDQTLDQLLHRRPLPGWSNYQSPIPGLYLCGSGTHPCGTVTGGPGHNAAHAILEDWKMQPNHQAKAS